jgi:4-oxalocrotonate tautomerase
VKIVPHASNNARSCAIPAGVSDLLFEVLGKPQSSTFVVIDEVELESWGVGGLTVPEYRREQAAAADKSK